MLGWCTRGVGGILAQSRAEALGAMRDDDTPRAVARPSVQGTGRAAEYIHVLAPE